MHVLECGWCACIYARDCMQVYAWTNDDITDINYHTLSTTMSPMQKSCRHASAFVHACMCIKWHTNGYACTDLCILYVCVQTTACICVHVLVLKSAYARIWVYRLKHDVCMCMHCMHMFIVKSKITAMTLTLKLCHPASGPAGLHLLLCMHIYVLLVYRGMCRNGCTWWCMCIKCVCMCSWVCVCVCV